MLCLFVEERRAARQHSTRAPDEKHLRLPATNLHRSSAPSLVFSRRRAALLRATAREAARAPRMAAGHWPSPRNVSGPAPGCGRGCSRGRIVASNTSNTHKNTLRTARWSCFPTSIFRPHPAVAKLLLPEMPAALTHTCISRGRVGKPVRRCGDGTYGRRECRPALLVVSRLCFRPSAPLPPTA